VRVFLLTLLLVGFLANANEEVYEQCVLDNIANANSNEAVELLKEVCQSKAKRNSCKGISPKEMSDEELLSGKCKPRKEDK
jgi:hypothetical protein